MEKGLYFQRVNKAQLIAHPASLRGSSPTQPVLASLIFPGGCNAPNGTPSGFQGDDTFPYLRLPFLQSLCLALTSRTRPNRDSTIEEFTGAELDCLFVPCRDFVQLLIDRQQ